MSTSPIYNQILSEISIGRRCHRPCINTISDEDIFSSSIVWIIAVDDEDDDGVKSILLFIIDEDTEALLFCGVGGSFCNFVGIDPTGTSDTLIEASIKQKRSLDKQLKYSST